MIAHFLSIFLINYYISHMKNLTNLKLDQLLQKFPGIKVEQEIKDTPRRVPNYHFCMSRPKVRNTPQLIGLSRNAAQLIGLSYEDVVADADSAFYLSGATLMEGSQVRLFSLSHSHKTIADISSANGQDSSATVEPTRSVSQREANPAQLSCN